MQSTEWNGLCQAWREREKAKEREREKLFMLRIFCIHHYVNKPQKFDYLYTKSAIYRTTYCYYYWIRNKVTNRISNRWRNNNINKQTIQSIPLVYLKVLLCSSQIDIFYPLRILCITFKVDSNFFFLHQSWNKSLFSRNVAYIRIFNPQILQTMANRWTYLIIRHCLSSIHHRHCRT